MTIAMPRIPPAPALFDQMFLTIGGQDIDLLFSPGDTLATIAAPCIPPTDTAAAVAFLDKLLDGRATRIDLKAWVNKRCRDIIFRDADVIEAFLHELREILATRPRKPPPRPVARRHNR